MDCQSGINLRPALLLIGLGLPGCTTTPEKWTAIPAQCADGGWGELDPATAVMVSRGGRADGAGTVDDPLADPAQAIELARSIGLSAVFVGPGTYPVSLQLSSATGDDDLTLSGCGVDSVLEGADEAVIWASDVQNVTILDLSISGGRPGLHIDQGATVELHRLTLSGSAVAGVVVAGAGTSAGLGGVIITNPIVRDTFAVGLLAQDASVELENVTVERATGVGVLIAASGVESEVSLADTRVVDTRLLADGSLGRGLQLNGLSRAIVDDTAISGGGDAGIYAEQVSQLHLESFNLENIAAGSIPGEVSTTGDAIVVSGSVGGAGVSDPALFTAYVGEGSVSGAARSGVLIERATVSIADTEISVDGDPVVAQDAAEVSGTDAVETSATNLDLNRGAVDAAALLAEVVR